MARNTAEILITNSAYVELTGGDATKITITFLADGSGIMLRTSATASLPSAGSIGHRYLSNNPNLINATLANLNPAVSLGKRVYARAIAEPVTLVVSDDSV